MKSQARRSEIKSVVRYWCRSGRRRIYRSKNSFSSKEVEPEYTTYTITEMASLKLDGQVSFRYSGYFL